MVNGNLGYAWGFRSNGYYGAVSRDGQLVRTTDGGLHWTVVRHTPSGGSQGFEIGNVTFVSATIGYLYGSQLWQTVDGGLTWRLLHSPHRIDQLIAADGTAWGVSRNRIVRIDADGTIHQDSPTAPITADDYGGLTSGNGDAVTALTNERTGHVRLWIRQPYGWASRSTPCQDIALDDVAQDGSIALVCDDVIGGAEALTESWTAPNWSTPWQRVGNPGEFGYPDGLTTDGSVWVMSRARAGIEVSDTAGRTWGGGSAVGHSPDCCDGWDSVSSLADGDAVAVPTEDEQGATYLAVTQDAAASWRLIRIRLRPKLLHRSS